MVELCRGQRLARVNDVEQDALADAVFLPRDVGVLFRLPDGVFRRVEAVLGLAHVVVGRADGEVGVFLRFLEVQLRRVAVRLRLVNLRIRHAAVKDVPVRRDAGLQVIIAAARRLERLRDRWPRRNADGRLLARLGDFHGLFLLLERVFVREDVLAAAQRVGDAVIERDVERIVRKIIREVQRLRAVEVHEVPQRREIDLVVVLRLDECLACVRELDRCAQLVDARFRARFVELRHVLEVRRVVINAVLIDVDGMARFERIEIRLDDVILQRLALALRREARDVQPECARTDVRLILAARVERERERQAEAAARAPIFVLLLARRGAGRCGRAPAVRTFRRAKLRLRRLFALRRHAQARVRCERLRDGILEREVARLGGRRRQREADGRGEPRRALAQCSIHMVSSFARMPTYSGPLSEGAVSEAD